MRNEKHCFIRMRNVDLKYPSTVYNNTTIKQEIFGLISKKNKIRRLDDVMALHDFSIEINEGDRVGVIGYNGAGKSTLLKAMAGLYPISSGSIETSGDIRSLLELTLGFDMFSTGRENIMYRGLMLGFTPQQIYEREDEIIDFAGLGEFIDYPITSYSSGMMVRLAFAISTSIEGEILLVDEVLSAGDAIFQAKARERMMNTIDKAKLLVLVLHDMYAIQEICNRVILLNHGRIMADGEPQEVVKFYLEHAE
ncbi:MAG: ABC transporter ATP-binding protein [Bacteroidales bacterium]|nr:ABC transporter ATP-binding protein [Bacteroidales bacterium]